MGIFENVFPPTGMVENYESKGTPSQLLLK